MSVRICNFRSKIFLFISFCLFLFALSLPSFGQLAGPRSPGIAANVVPSPSANTYAWTSVNNALTDGGTFTTANFAGANNNHSTQILRLTNFGFSEGASAGQIPVGATINGILVEIKMKGNRSVRDDDIRLLKAGSPVGNNKARGSTNWPATAVYVPFGSSTDLWGTTWTTAELINSGFGIQIVAKQRGIATAIPEIHHVRITVYFNITRYFTKNTTEIPGAIDITQLSSWTTNSTGATATQPPNFTNNGQVFNIIRTVDFNGSLTISGIASKLSVGTMAGATGTLTIGSTSTLSVPEIDVLNTSTLNINSATTPNFGVINAVAPLSTVSFGRSGDQSIPRRTYGNLTFGGSGTKSFTGSLEATAVGLVTVNSGVTLANPTASTLTVNNVVNNGTITGTLWMTGPNGLTLSGTGTVENLLVDMDASGNTLSVPTGSMQTITNLVTVRLGTFSTGTAGAAGRITMQNQGLISLEEGTFVGIPQRANSTHVYDVDYVSITNKTSADAVRGAGLRDLDVNLTSGLTLTLGSAVTMSGNLTIATGNTLDVSASNFGITLGGNFVNNGTFNRRSGTVTFNGTGAQSIGGTGTQNFHILTVNKATGALTLNNPVIANNTLNLTSGIVNSTITNLLTLPAAATLNGGSVTSYVNGPLRRSFNTNTLATRVFPVGKSGLYRPVTLNIRHNATTATDYTVEQIEGAPAVRNFPVGINSINQQRYFVINRGSGATVVDASVILRYGPEDNINDPNTIRMLKSSGGDWIDIGGIGVGEPSGTIQSDINFTQFSDFGIGSIDSTLPLIWRMVSAESKNQSIITNWQTADEEDVSHFEVEYSTDGFDWEVAGKVESNYGNSLINDYSFTFFPKRFSNKYFIRIKQIDFSGAFDYSDIVRVNFAFNSENNIKIYPNPSDGRKIRITDSAKRELSKIDRTITIYNSIGGMVVNLKWPIHETEKILPPLTKGTYIIKINTGDASEWKRFIVY